MVNRHFREQYDDALDLLSARPGAGRARHRHRRRLRVSTTTSAARAGPPIRRATWAASTRDPHADAGRPRRHLVPARPHPARLSGIAGDARSSPGRSARGNLQYAAMWKVAQRMTEKPVKFGTYRRSWSPSRCRTGTTRAITERMLAIADALNEEYHELADAGCPVIQFEEPQIHMLGGAQDQRQGHQPGIHASRCSIAR